MGRPRLAVDIARADHPGLGPIPDTVSPFLCIDFVNSRFTDHTGTGEIYDRLGSRHWQRWIAERAGVRVARAPTPEACGEMIRMRATLRDLLESRSEPDERELRRINRHLARSPRTWQLSRAESGFALHETHPRNWEAVLAAVLASYAALLGSGQIARVGRCANPDCSFLFYDESRNGSRRWCDAASCGNLHSVRLHRERLRSARGRAPR